MAIKKLFLAALFSLSLGASFHQPGLAAPAAQTVVTTGEASLDNGQAAAREQAIAQANRLAVEQALGVYVVSETLVENFEVVKDTILTQSSGYVSGYKILSEGSKNGIYSVKVQATVSVEPLVEQLAKLGLLRDWTVAVVLVSNGEARASNEAAKSKLNQFMLEKGFKVADENALVQLNQPGVMEQIMKGNYLAALPVLRDQGVDVLVVGSTLTRPTEDGPMETYAGIKTVMTQGRIDARVLRVDTGEMLASKSFQAVAGGSAQDLAEAKAMDKAATDAGQFFSLEIAKLPAATSQKLQLVINGLNFNREQAFRSALQKLPGVRKVTKKSFANNRTQYEIDFAGKADGLAEALAGHASLKGFKVEIQAVTSGNVQANAK